MNERYYTKGVIKTLRRYARSRSRDLGRRPLFIFSCGGEEGPAHPARADLKRYIERSALPALDNVICLKAEAIAKEGLFGDMDLLAQEAIIADVADWLVIFAESVGSFCELGAFASLPHVQTITSVAVGQKYYGENSFLIDGPVKALEEVEAPLSHVFYLDLMCPLASFEFTRFVDSIRNNVKLSEEIAKNRGRKLVNNNAKNIILGSLVHELLDLVFLTAPVFEDDLLDLYCAVKQFPRRGLTIRSRTLNLDMGKARSIRITPHQIVSFMLASDMLHTVLDSSTGRLLLNTDIHLHDFFMFRRDASGELNELRMKMALDKRRDGVGSNSGFYRRSAL